MTTGSPEIQLRRAVVTDADLVLALIHELAAEEEFPFPVTATPADLKANLLARDSVATTLIASVDNKVVGFVVFYTTFATTTGKPGIHVDDLYIRPAYQGLGLGKVILRHIACIAESRGCARMEWWALKANRRAIAFYERLGARQMDEIALFRMDRDRISQWVEE